MNEVCGWPLVMATKNEMIEKDKNEIPLIGTKDLNGRLLRAI